MTVAHSPHPAALPRRILRALGSLLALAVLLIGVPAILLAAGTLPGRLPGGGELWKALSAPDDGHLLLEALTLLAWAGWGWFLLSFLLESIALVFRRPARRRRAMGGPQRLAAFLLGGLLVLPAGTAMASSGPAVAAVATHLPIQKTTPAPHTDAQESAPGPVHVVGETGETVWDLAREFLGDGRRYEEIRTLNPHLPDTALLPPKTQVRLPADAQLSTPAAPSPPAASHREPASPSGAAHLSAQEAASPHAITTNGPVSPTYTVKSGDTLWHIAQDKLGSPEAYPQIAAANPDTVKDPDLIYPGERLTLPTARPGTPSATPVPTTPPRQTPTPHPPSSKPTPGPTTQPSQNSKADPSASATTPSAEPPTVPASPAQPSRPAASLPAQGAPTASSVPSAASTAPATSSSRGIELRTAAGAFALLAGAVTGALALRRLLQRRRRAPGETIAIAEETSLAAAQLAEAAEPTLVDELDLALRTLAHHAHEDGRPLPVMRAARLGQHAIDLLPAEVGTEPQRPFVAVEDGWWTLPAAAELLDSEQVQSVPAPYPVLTTIGATEDGTMLLLNLAHTRVLLLNGTAQHIRETCTSLALELGMSPWAQRVEIMTLGFGEELPHLLPTSRIAHKREPAHAVRDLGDWMLTAFQQPEHADQPYLLLCAAVLDSDTAWQLAEAFDKASDLPVVLVAPAAQTSHHFGDAEVLDVSSSEPQEIEDIGLPVRLQRLEDAAFQQIATELRISGQPPIPAEDPWQNVPPEPDTPAQAPPSTGTDPAETPAAVSGPASTTSELGAFPALLSATTDPAALRLVPTPAAAAPSTASTSTGLADASPSPEAAPSAAARTPHEENADGPHDLHAPEISVLGPIHVPRNSTSHGPRVAQLAALLYFKPGRSADTLCVDMDPLTPWSKKTLDSRLGDLRRCLGDDPNGDPYVPRRSRLADGYSLSPHVQCDWTKFQQLAKRALTAGPAAVRDLERALGLVRGKPFGPAPLPWAEPHQQEMVTRIIDVAHTVATWRMVPGPHHDLAAARQAVATGLEVDESAELIYRDWMRIEHADDNRPGLFTASARVQQVSRTNRCPLDLETEQLIDRLLGAGQRAQGW